MQNHWSRDKKDGRQEVDERSVSASHGQSGQSLIDTISDHRLINQRLISTQDWPSLAGRQSNQGNPTWRPLKKVPTNPYFGQPSFGQPLFQPIDQWPTLGQTSFGQTSFGQTSFGQTSFGQSSFGQSSFGQSSFGQQFTGQCPYQSGHYFASGQEFTQATSSVAQQGFSQQPIGQQPIGQESFGQESFGQESFGQESFGQTNPYNVTSNYQDQDDRRFQDERGYKSERYYQDTAGSRMKKRFLSGGEIESLINQFRVWKRTKYGREFDQRVKVDPTLSSKCMQFKLTSYNILSQDLLDYHSSLYSKCSHRTLNWVSRFQQITDELCRIRSNIVCLQEVNQQHFDSDLAPFFNAYGYKTLYKKRVNKQDGCALAYDEKSFKLVHSVQIEFNQVSVHPNLDRENVAILALLEPKNPYLKAKGIKIVVATTHLLFNPKRGDIKINQIRLLLAEIHQMACKENGRSLLNGHDQTLSEDLASDNLASQDLASNDCHPVILCGDFNTLPGSPIHQFLIKGN